MTELLIILLLGGLFLIGAEIFVPGGVLGTVGGLALIGAGVVAFINPDIATSTAIAINCGIVILVGIVVYLWIKFFPQTGVGRRMTVNKDLHNAKGTESGLRELAGHTGITKTQLHPGGIAEIDGRRVDVITNGEMIDCEIKIILI